MYIDVYLDVYSIVGGSYIEHHRTGFPHVFTIRNLVTLGPTASSRPLAGPADGCARQVAGHGAAHQSLSSGRLTRGEPQRHSSVCGNEDAGRSQGAAIHLAFVQHLCSYWLTLADISSVMNIPTISKSFCTTNTQSLTWFRFLPPRALWSEVKIVGPKIKVILVKIFKDQWDGQVWVPIEASNVMVLWYVIGMLWCYGVMFSMLKICACRILAFLNYVHVWMGCNGLKVTCGRGVLYWMCKLFPFPSWLVRKFRKQEHISRKMTIWSLEIQVTFFNHQNKWSGYTASQIAVSQVVGGNREELMFQLITAPRSSANGWLVV